MDENIKNLIKNMGCFEADIRNQALEKLKGYLQDSNMLSSVYEHDSMILVWKGLYDMMLRQAEPLLQEDLAEEICSLSGTFKNMEDLIIFIQCGIETLARERFRTNHFMHNKMMMFFRRLFRHGISYIAKKQWQHQKEFVKMLQSTIIIPGKDSQISLETQMHFADIYLEEIAKSKNETLDELKVMIFLEPFLEVLRRGENFELMNHIKSSIFCYLLSQSDAGIDNRADLAADEIVVDTETGERSKSALGVSSFDVSLSDDCEMDEDLESQNITLPLDPRAGNVDVVLPQLEVDYKKLSSIIHDMVKDGKNRKQRNLLSKLACQLFEANEGQYYLGTHPSLLPSIIKETDEEYDNKLSGEGIQRALEDEEMLKQKKVAAPILAETVKDFENEKQKKGAAEKLFRRKKRQSKIMKQRKKRSLRKRSDNNAGKLLRQNCGDSEFVVKVLDEQQAQASIEGEKMNISNNSVHCAKKGITEAGALKNKSKDNIFKSKVRIVQSSRKMKGTDANQKTQKKLTPTNSSSKTVKSNEKMKRTGIKIVLKNNQQHEFSDYKESILASPALPFQPDRAPMRTALKATNNPILVKKPLSKTLRSIPTKSRLNSKTLQNNKEKKTNIKISATVLKQMKRKGVSPLQKDPVKRKAATSPAASVKRAKASDFF